MVAIAQHTIVEAGIDEEVGRDVFVELDGEGVLPLPLHTFISRESLHARFPVDVVGNLPLQVNGELRTYFVQRVLAFLQAVAGGQG